MSEKKIQTYDNGKIKIQYDPNICEHAAECVKGSPQVFNTKQRPWVQPDNDSLENIRNTIHKCPTGALSYTLADGTSYKLDTTSNEQAVDIVVIPNGPLRVSGLCGIKDMDGNLIKETDRVSLCRCGASKNKPFCDGAHKAIGFTG